MQLTIEKMIYGGDGLSHLPADENAAGKAVFVPFVLEGERVEARLVEERPGFARARAESMVTPSPMRQQPGCPYFGVCGGCQYQHTSYQHQLEIKRGVLAETVRRIAKIDLPAEPELHPSPEWNYRNRTRVRVRTNPQFTLGYNRFGSHETLAVKECPISSPLINRVIAPVWEVGSSGEVPAHISEIEFFANQDDTQLLLELTMSDRWPRKDWVALARFAEELRRRMPEISGVAVFRAARTGMAERERIPRNERDVFGAQQITYDAAGFEYKVSAGAFFQTNRHMTEELVRLVTAGRSGEAALDLYCGVGLFTVPLARAFARVESVEASPLSYSDLLENVPENVRAHQATTERFLDSVSRESRFDHVVVDPPRGGLGEKGARKLGKLEAPRVTYISCDPATLARDLRVLTAAGYVIERMHLVDLFPQTFHIESVTELVGHK